MSLTISILLGVALTLTIIVPFAVYAAGEKNKGRYKKALAVNLSSFVVAMIISQG